LLDEYYDLIQETLSSEQKVFCLRQLMSSVECCTEEKVELMLSALLRQRSPLTALIALQRKVFIILRERRFVQFFMTKEFLCVRKPLPVFLCEAFMHCYLATSFNNLKYLKMIQKSLMKLHIFLKCADPGPKNPDSNFCLDAPVPDPQLFLN
jgi:hypothetical protein